MRTNKIDFLCLFTVIEGASQNVIALFFYAMLVLLALTTEAAALEVQAESKTDYLEAAIASQTSSTGSNSRSPESETELLSQLDRAMEQVTDVNQLRDVQPTDWAYEALRGLVERYGCVEGYPDQTYRGNRALTRYEFAAGLFSCLNTVEQLIASGGGALTPEDLERLQRLAQEFEAELAILGTRIDNLEGRTAFLEDNQFSTTTKLTGNVFFNITGAFADGDIRAEGESAFTAGDDVERVIDDDPEITFSNYVFLNFNTSFSGQDNLVLQLVSGNGDSPANQFVSAGLFNTFGVPFTDQTGVTGGDNNVVLREAFYDFPITSSLRFVVGSRINWYRYFDNNAFTFFLTGASSFNSSGSTQLNAIDRGSGLVALWDITDFLSLRVGYLGENTEFLPSPPFNTSSDPEEGLFGGTNTTTVELDIRPIETATLRFIYDRTNIDANDGTIGGATGEPIYGFADDGFGGPIGDATADTFAFNFDWLVTPRFGIFGRYSFGSTNIFPLTPGLDDGEINAQSFQFGVAFPDLIKEGGLGTFSFVVPFDILDGEEFLASGAGDGGTQFDFELTYFYPVNANIALVPAFYLIANPNNFEENPVIYVGNLRMQFSF